MSIASRLKERSEPLVELRFGVEPDSSGSLFDDAQFERVAGNLQVKGDSGR